MWHLILNLYENNIIIQSIYKMKKAQIENYAIRVFLVTLMISAALISCKNQGKSDETTSENSEAGVVHPAWANDAVIYELNVRQYSEEGTFNAVTQDLTRLQDLGIEIIWLMPVNPIGELNRKGELGSYYSVKNYRAVNPEFGTIQDFKMLVNRAHELGMKVIIDWVPNHSAWDNPLAKEHPDWYVRDEEGNLQSPFDWTDVIQFDYNNSEMRNYMIESLKYWLKETNIDGFRFDVAHMIPVDFWDDVRQALMEVKEVFMLGESDQPWLHENAMDMTYDWKFHHIMNEVANGKMTVTDIRNHFDYVDSVYPPNSILMEFTSNHDENSWAGTVYDRLGEGVKTFAAITFTVPGMPLIYNGQEACMDKMLEFFVRDPIEWKECDMTEFYRELIDLRTENPALWSGNAGGDFQIFSTDHNDKVFAFSRSLHENIVISVYNLSDDTLTVNLPENLTDGNFSDYLSGSEVKPAGSKVELYPWDFDIYVK